jgi:phosphomannomutase
MVVSEHADLGIVVDPDVDRLAFIDEKGKMFGEEYTLVAVADYILKNYRRGVYKKVTVSNLSSSRALGDISKNRGGFYYASAVGEVNVVKKMKEKLAIIGGEGNGGIIYPQFHYGRDALVGTALFLSSLAGTKKTVSELKKEFPLYFMVKDRLDLVPGLDLKKLLKKIKQDYLSQQVSEIDGLKIDWPDSWIHLRASNTEPIIRIYSEASKLPLARARVSEIKRKILAYIK